MLRALRGRLATTGGKLIILSSPYGQSGALYDLHRRHYSRDDSPTLVWQGSAPELVQRYAFARSLASPITPPGLNGGLHALTTSTNDPLAVLMRHGRGELVLACPRGRVVISDRPCGEAPAMGDGGKSGGGVSLGEVWRAGSTRWWEK